MSSEREKANAMRKLKLFHTKKNRGLKFVYIQTNSRCNAFCLLCPYPKFESRLSHGQMGENLYKKIVDQVANHEVSSFWPYLMNEPLLDPNIVERIKYAKEKLPKTRLGLATNASLLSKEKGRQLLEAGIEEMRISIHGFSKASYEKWMPGLNFEQSLGNIKNFISLSRAEHVKIFLTPVHLRGENESDIEKIKEFAQENGVRTYVWPFLDRAGNLDFHNLKIHHQELYGCLFNRQSEWLHVLYNGDVILCCMDWNRETVIGNLNEQSLDDIWGGEAFENIRAKVSGDTKTGNNFICKKCCWA